MSFVGQHILVDLYDCQTSAFDDPGFIRAEMTLAAERMGAEIVSVEINKFNPIGISGVVVISESHLTIHTWPEYGYAAVDIFTCGPKMNAERAIASLGEALGAADIQIQRFERGRIDRDGRIRAPEAKIPAKDASAS